MAREEMYKLVLHLRDENMALKMRLEKAKQIIDSLPDYGIALCDDLGCEHSEICRKVQDFRALG